MDANILHAFQGLDFVHILALIAIVWLLVKHGTLSRIASIMTGKPAPASGSNGTKANIETIFRRLDRHERECRENYAKMTDDIGQLKATMASIESKVDLLIEGKIK